VFRLKDELCYDGSLFDAHTHIIGTDLTDLIVEVAVEYGVERSLAIIHDHEDLGLAEKEYPGRFTFAKYFSGAALLTQEPRLVVEEVKNLKEQGYSVAKAHFAPFWLHRVARVPEERQIDCERFDVFFDALSDEDIPLIVHVSDPDTYYRTRYTDSLLYGTKDEHIQEFENRLSRNTSIRIQAAHLAAQPEPNRLKNLDRMLQSHRNLSLDTSSARWMARELGREPQEARAFIVRNSDRILFATDCVTRTEDRSYYDGRHLALRLLFETDLVDVPLPFSDPDTVSTGGTSFSGLGLPDSVLNKIYWDNAVRFFDE
jgi:predicted TIM-barrel fold metal-dependent hydrolase